MLFGDFETRSACDLRKAGADVYARHPSTELLCFGFAFEEEAPGILLPDGSSPKFAGTSPDAVYRVMDYIDKGGTFVAHNAPFELVIWNEVCVKKYGWPKLDPKQVICTMAQAYAMSLPGSLEKCCPAVGMKVVKDMAGARVMHQLAQPRKVSPEGAVTWWTQEAVPEKFEKLYRYCMQDIVVTRDLFKRLLQLSHEEFETWLLDRKINDRGVGVDVSAIQKAIAIVDSEKRRLDLEMRELTSNAVSTCNAVRDLALWLNLNGVRVEGVAKEHVLDALATEGIPPLCRKALLLRQEAAKASTAKLKAMLLGQSDGRVRGTLQYHGANTGRWAARRMQLHNLPRPKLKQRDIEDVFDILNTGGELSRDTIDMFYGSPLSVLSDCLRGFLCAAPGNDLIAADLSQIEARMLAWLAGEEKKLDVFRRGESVYERAAADIYHVQPEEITEEDPRRQIGKVSELACGFQGAVNAFQSMAGNYGIKIPDKEADEIVKAWRAANPRIVCYWYELENAAIHAVLKPGQSFPAGIHERAVHFKMVGSFLWCQLPSKRVLCYPYPEVKSRLMPWGKMKDCLSYMSENSVTRKWERCHTYGGSLAENCTQACARDILVGAMKLVESFPEFPFPVVLHVHDELIAEIPEALPPDTLAIFEALVSEVPDWAAGLPIACKGWRGKRYRKG